MRCRSFGTHRLFDWDRQSHPQGINQLAPFFPFEQAFLFFRNCRLLRSGKQGRLCGSRRQAHDISGAMRNGVKESSRSGVPIWDVSKHKRSSRSAAARRQMRSLLTRSLRDGDEITSASGRSRVRPNAGLRREFQAPFLANAATNAGSIYARFLARPAAATKEMRGERRERRGVG